MIYLVRTFTTCIYLTNNLYRWDTLTGDLELVDSLNGHYDIIYGKYDPRYLTR